MASGGAAREKRAEHDPRDARNEKPCVLRRGEAQMLAEEHRRRHDVEEEAVEVEAGSDREQQEYPAHPDFLVALDERHRMERLAMAEGQRLGQEARAARDEHHPE